MINYIFKPYYKVKMNTIHQNNTTTTELFTIENKNTDVLIHRVQQKNSKNIHQHKKKKEKMRKKFIAYLYDTNLKK